jgi:GH3 auxin-responsive promoter
MRVALSVGASRFRRKFLSDARRAQAVNDALLMELLRKNQDTVYGRQFGFAKISTPAEYRASVPLTSYADYEPYVARIAQGEQGVLTAEPVHHFGLSSGTTGKQKMIPITRTAQHRVALVMVFLVQGMLNAALPGRGRGPGLLMMSAGTTGKTEAGITYGPATASGLASMIRMGKYLWTTPPDALVLLDQRTVLHLHLLFALKERALTYLSAPFASSIMDLFHLLERAGPALAQELETGKLSPELNLSGESRARLEADLGQDPERARQLLAELERGQQGIAQRLWPKLGYVSTVTGGGFAVYAQKLRPYLGDVPFFSSVYASTEGTIGVATRPEDTSYAMVPSVCSFELLPAGEVDAASPRTVTLEEAQEGEHYEVVLTNRSGFYRYRLGDMVKVVGRLHQTPVIEFLFRRGQLLNLSGEKTSEQAALAAVMDAAERWRTPLIDFTTMADTDAAPARYAFFVEVKEPSALAGRATAADELDQALGKANPRYQAAREAGKLGRPVLHAVERDTFVRVKALLIEKGASANQVKIPRVVSAGAVLQLLRAGSIGT